MAKGLRSSVKKANRSRLRSKVFGPVEEARKQRLSAKLLSKTLEPSPNAKEDAMLLDDSPYPPMKTNTSPGHGDSSIRAKSRELLSERMQVIPEDGNRSPCVRRETISRKQQVAQATPQESTICHGLPRIRERKIIRHPQKAEDMKAYTASRSIGMQLPAQSNLDVIEFELCHGLEYSLSIRMQTNGSMRGIRRKHMKQSPRQGQCDTDGSISEDVEDVCARINRTSWMDCPEYETDCHRDNHLASVGGALFVF
ncbi:MAG: hypothetical protein Q9209_003262 [Squamulea sp. 1 TL-2023]